MARRILPLVVAPLLVFGAVALGCSGDPAGTDPGQGEPPGPGEREGGAHPEASAPPGTPPPAPPSCAVPNDLRLTPTVEGEHSLGSFRVATTPASFTVTHTSRGAEPVFTTGAGMLSASRHALSVEEHQGSFEIHEKDTTTCSGAVVREAGASGGVLRLRGGFATGPAACAALTFTMDLCEARPGHLAFDTQVSDPSFSGVDLFVAKEADERVYGLGEQFPHDSLDLRGRVFPILAQEGGVGRGHQPISASVNTASKGSAGHEGSTYYAAPHVLTSRRRSFFLENEELSMFDLTQAAHMRVRTYAPRVRGRILAGKTPLELVERYTDFAGRMPRLPDWVDEGAIVALARPLEESLALVTRMRAAGVQISAVWNQTWPGKAKTFIGEQVLWNWAYNPNYHPDWQSYVSALAGQNIKTLCYVNSMFREVPSDAGKVERNTYEEGLRLDAFVKNPTGATYKLPVTAFDVALLDLSNPSARTFMKGLIKSEMIDKAKCSGWMADFAEALPFDARMRSGATGADYHNTYTVEWAKLNREVVEENGLLGKVLVWNRSGHTRSPGASLLFWEGDQLTTWDKYDGLVSALHGLLNGGLSGMSLNHSDTGGYTSLSAGGVGYTREDEQLKRWAEMSAFTAVLRTHEGNQPGANAQAYDTGDTLTHFARMSKIYKALGFYRKELYAEAETKGYPLVRTLFLEFPDDAASWDVDDEMMLGSEILVAPVKNKCFTAPLCPYDKEVYLPPGEWTHLFSGTSYGRAGQGTKVTVKAPLGQPAVFYKKGSRVGATLVTKLRADGVM